jgi:acetyl esterase/lipase
MDQLPPLGTTISQVVAPTYRIYAPLLYSQADKIKSTRRQSFPYGPDPRQKLDVYFPASATEAITGNDNSVLVFLYGGGFVKGERINTKDFDGLVYANVGHFFAETLGFKVVIMDYRLLSHGARFPSGGEDLRLVVEWIQSHLNQSSTHPLELYLMGNSAGGVHLSTYLLAPDFAASRSRVLPTILKGVFLLSVPLHFEEADPERHKTLQAYFGSDIPAKSPLGLLRAAKLDRSIEALRGLPVMVVTGTLDPKIEILTPAADFVREWQTCPLLASALVVETMEGHNHISPVLGLGTGDPLEEEWGHQVARFIRATSRAS